MLFFTSTEMVINFSERQEAERCSQEVAIQHSTPNPTRAMKRTLIPAAVTTSSKDTTTPTTTLRPRQVDHH